MDVVDVKEQIVEDSADSNQTLIPISQIPGENRPQRPSSRWREAIENAYRRLLTILSFGPETESTRIYQVWPGNNVFFFRGRMICGPDPKGIVLTTTSIVLSSWIFCVYIGDDLHNHSAIIITFSIVFTLMVLVNLILTSTRDPGIIPRSKSSPLNEVGTSDEYKTRKVCVNGVEVKLKYCRICMIFRSPRSCHCAICNNCVEKFDHHCPWLGQCVGLRNYRNYLMFVTSALFFFTYLLVFTCRKIRQKMTETNAGVYVVMSGSPEYIVLVVLSTVAVWFLGGLVVFHSYLVIHNQTAYENFKQRYVNCQNPYDRGVLSNIKEVLLARIPPSRVNFRGEVDGHEDADSGLPENQRMPGRVFFQ